MARTRTARQDGGTFAASGTFQQFSVNHLQRYFSEQSLRRLIPYLLTLFLVTLLAGALSHFYYGKRIATGDARIQLSLIADTIAAKLHNTSGPKLSDWQSRLAASLPARATLEGRQILLSDASGKIRAVAPITANGAGRTLVQILGKNQPVSIFAAQAGVMEFILSDGREALVTVRNIANSQAALTLLQPTGAALEKWRRQSAMGTTLLLTTGMLLLLISVSFRWLSERSDRAEAALATRERDMDILFDTSRVGLWDWNVARGHVRISKSMNALMGWSEREESVPFGDIAAALHPEDNLYAAVEAAIHRGSERVDETFRVRHENGTWTTLHLQGFFRREGAGNEIHLVGVVSEEKPDENCPHAALAQDDRLHDAVAAISEAFVLWDVDNRLVMCNEKYQEFYNLTDEAVVPGTPYEHVIAEATAPVVRTRITVSNNKNAGARTYEAQLEDGSWLHINERRTKEGGYVSVGTDITSLKQSEQRQLKSEDELKATITDLRHSRRELEQQKQQLVDLMEKYVLEKNRAEAANRAKSEFLANISHELRTPLNAVIGFSEVMTNNLFGPLGNKKYQEYAHDIHESGKHLLEVINDVLDMSKIEAGRINLDIDTLDAGEIIDDSIRVVAPTATEKSIKVRRTGLKQLEIRADKRALKQILLNLLSNAMKFTPSGGKVTVRLTKARGYAKIMIADTGIGIPEEKLKKLGRPFEQVENQLTKSHRGSGLGLAISRSLVEMHGGKFEIASVESKGTTVMCHLPLKPILSEDDGVASGQSLNRL